MCHVFSIKPTIRLDVKRASFFSRKNLIDGLFRVKECQFGTEELITYQVFNNDIFKKCLFDNLHISYSISKVYLSEIVKLNLK